MQHRTGSFKGEAEESCAGKLQRKRMAELMDTDRRGKRTQLLSPQQENQRAQQQRAAGRDEEAAIRPRDRIPD